MEKLDFPWLKDEPPLPSAQPEPLSTKERLLSLTRAHLPKIAILGALFGLLTLGKCSSQAQVRSTPRPPSTFTVMTSLVAIPKGHRLPEEMLSPLEIRASTLSKAQTLKALVPEQITSLRHDVVAKRDIAPHTPIFWTDLSLRSQNSLPISHAQSPRVHFAPSSEAR